MLSTLLNSLVSFHIIVITHEWVCCCLEDSSHMYSNPLPPLLSALHLIPIMSKFAGSEEYASLLSGILRTSGTIRSLWPFRHLYIRCVRTNAQYILKLRSLCIFSQSAPIVSLRWGAGRQALFIYPGSRMRTSPWRYDSPIDKH